ncbi:MAG: site-2 protease family protein [Aphanothece sp. CMT-3BRIN-NPC111]|jgi:membrane-associated protease RseP (regulator of RpoE activity)|nr:site-2 protease family protein [Aphanothece sp. CMT-3BRIN-NPC111]
MEFWLLLILLGLLTYFIVKRSVANITRTPVWLLWLVIMTPALIWSAWTLVYGEKTPIPPALAIGPFVGCSLLYWLLIQWGRKPPSSEPGVAAAPQKQDSDASQTTDDGGDISKLRPISATEETNLRNCFPWSIYYLENIEYRPQAVLCRGKLRSNPDAAYKTIREKIEGQFGDRFFVLFQESLSGKPFFALVPNPQAQATDKPKSEPLTRPGLALLLLLITLFTTTVIGAEIAGISSKQLQSNPAVLLQGLPYALALMTILGIHELGHYFTAVFYKIRTTLPYFIPLPFFLGTFGAFIQMRSPIPNRKALFDLGISGPLSGFIVTLPLLLWGLAHSTLVPLSDNSGIWNFESLNPRLSLLLTLLSKWALGSELTSKMAIDLHPVAIAGYIGLVVTALNLIPVGQLDGGHIVHAMFGQRIGAVIGQIARLLVLGLAFLQPELLLWAVILLFMPVADEPALNDVSELDNWRDFGGLLALALLVSILLPVPGTLTQLLNI